MAPDTAAQVIPASRVFRTRKGADNLAERDREWLSSEGGTVEVREVEGGWQVVVVYYT